MLLLPYLGPLDIIIWNSAGTNATWTLGMFLYFMNTFTIILIPAMLMGMTFPLP